MLKPEGYDIRFPKKGGPPGDHGSVAFTAKLWKQFEKDASDEGRSQVEAAMRTWCRFGSANMPKTKFKFQKQIDKGGKKARIDEFKGRHVRLYGMTVEVDKKSMFLVLGADLAKKRDPANNDLLKRVGKEAHRILDAADNQAG